MFSIVHIDTERTWRGGQQALLTLAKGLRARGHEQLIVCPPVAALAERAVAEGLEVVALTGSRDLRLLFRRANYQIVHAHSGRAQNLAFLGSMGTNVRRVVTRHVTFRPQSLLIHRLKYSMTCHGIIAVSDAVRDSLILSGLLPKQIEVIRTGVEFPRVVPDEADRKASRRRFGLAAADFVVGHLGAFTAEKGQDVAVEAARLLQSRLPDMRWVLAGDGALLDSIRAQAKGLPVMFPGFIEDQSEFFAALDLFVMPSRSEAWGLAALSAMAHGVPVIASDTGGLIEIVDDGWRVPAGDARALAEAIAALNRDRLREAGLAAREKAKRFSSEETAKQTEAYYEKILKGRSTSLYS